MRRPHRLVVFGVLLTLCSAAAPTRTAAASAHEYAAMAAAAQARPHAPAGPAADAYPAEGWTGDAAYRDAYAAAYTTALNGPPPPHPYAAGHGHAPHAAPPLTPHADADVPQNPAPHGLGSAARRRADGHGREARTVHLADLAAPCELLLILGFAFALRTLLDDPRALSVAQFAHAFSFLFILAVGGHFFENLIGTRALVDLVEWRRGGGRMRHGTLSLLVSAGAVFATGKKLWHDDEAERLKRWKASSPIFTCSAALAYLFLGVRLNEVMGNSALTPENGHYFFDVVLCPPFAAFVCIAASGSTWLFEALRQAERRGVFLAEQTARSAAAFERPAGSLLGSTPSPGTIAAALSGTGGGRGITGTARARTTTHADQVEWLAKRQREFGIAGGLGGGGVQHMQPPPPGGGGGGGARPPSPAHSHRSNPYSEGYAGGGSVPDTPGLRRRFRSGSESTPSRRPQPSPGGFGGLGLAPAAAQATAAAYRPPSSPFRPVSGSTSSLTLSPPSSMPRMMHALRGPGDVSSLISDDDSGSDGDDDGRGSVASSSRPSQYGSQYGGSQVPIVAAPPSPRQPMMHLPALGHGGASPRSSRASSPGAGSRRRLDSVGSGYGDAPLPPPGPHQPSTLYVPPSLHRAASAAASSLESLVPSPRNGDLTASYEQLMTSPSPQPPQLRASRSAPSYEQLMTSPSPQLHGHDAAAASPFPFSGDLTSDDSDSDDSEAGAGFSRGKMLARTPSTGSAGSNSIVDDWVEAVDQATGATYFSSASLGVTQWEEPVGFARAGGGGGL